jgi:hypothetical protein
MAQMGHPRFLLSGSRVRRMRDEERYSIDLHAMRLKKRVKCKRLPQNRVQLELLSRVDLAKMLTAR